MGLDYSLAGKTLEEVAADVDARIPNDYLLLVNNPYRGVIEDIEFRPDRKDGLPQGVFRKPEGLAGMHYESVAADLLARHLRDNNFREFDDTEAWYQEAAVEATRLVLETDTLSPATIEKYRRRPCQDIVTLPLPKRKKS